MAYSTDFGGNGTAHLKGARNEHKAAQAVNKEKVTAGRTHAREKAGKRAPTAKGANASKGASAAHGVRIARRFSTAGSDPLDQVVYERRSSAITNPDGSIVFKMEGAEVPAGWSQLATDIVISKYFRKAGLHGDKDMGETSVRQVVHRLAHTIRSARQTKLRRLLRRPRPTPTRSRPSSRICSSTSTARSTRRSGSTWAFGTSTESTDRAATGPGTRARRESPRPARAYERPQCSACFIQAVKDDLMAIYDLVK